jgi:hypothetical protein
MSPFLTCNVDHEELNFYALVTIFSQLNLQLGVKAASVASYS